MMSDKVGDMSHQRIKAMQREINWLPTPYPRKVSSKITIRTFDHSSIRLAVKLVSRSTSSKVVVMAPTVVFFITKLYDKDPSEMERKQNIYNRRISLVLRAAFNNPRVEKIDLGTAILDDRHYNEIRNYLLLSSHVKHLTLPTGSREQNSIIESTLTSNVILESLIFLNLRIESVKSIRA